MSKAPRAPLSFDPAPVVRSLALVSTTTKPGGDLQQVGARIPRDTYRQLKARAALQGVTVQTLVEQAISTYLDRPETVGE